MISVRVFRSVGDTAVVGKKVTVSGPGGMASATTDRNGTANFNLSGGKHYEVFVDGKRVHRGPISGVQVVYL